MAIKGLTQVFQEAEVPKPQVKPEVKIKGEVAGLVDELVMIQTKIVDLEIDEILKRKEEIRKRLQLIADETVLPQKEAVFEGEDGSVLFAPNQVKIEVTDLQALRAAIGDEAFWSIIKANLTDIRKYASPAEMEKFTKQVYGSRVMKAIVPKIK